MKNIFSSAENNPELDIYIECLVLTQKLEKVVKDSLMLGSGPRGRERKRFMSKAELKLE